MLQTLIVGLLWFSAVGCGLLAGLYFAFSAFIMTALGRIGQAAGIAAMNAINIAIVQSLFMPVFLATTAASAALAVIALLRWGEPGAMAMATGGVLYVLGMFVVTMICNVPLNNALAAADPASHERIKYLRGDAALAETATRLRELTGPEPKAMVILGAGARNQVLDAFRNLAALVPIGSYAIVEDTVLDGDLVWPEFGDGPRAAVSR